jgi:fructoselysine-6-phosphate deglycase
MEEDPVLKFDEEEHRAQVASAVALRPQIEKLITDRRSKGLKNIYLIGSGGSYAAMLPYEYLMNSRTEFPVKAVIAPEFALAPDPGFGEGSLAVFASATGTTEDVNAVIRFAKERGAYTIGFTGEAESPFATEVDEAFLSDAHHYDIQLALLCTFLLSERGEFTGYSEFAEQLTTLPASLVEIAKKADPIASAFAEAHKETGYHFVVGSGSVWGFAYLYSMCVLEECQWLHTTRVHAAEFFHGSLELIEEDTSVILFVPEDESRPLMERVDRFTRRYSADVNRFDAADYPLPGVDDRFRGLLSPLVVDTVAERISKHLERVRDHDLKLRRYYRVVEY